MPAIGLIRRLGRPGRHKAQAVSRDQLALEMREHGGAAQLAKVEIEVGIDRHKLADLDRSVPFAQAVERLEARRVVIAGDIEPAQIRCEVEGGEVIGREGGDQWAAAAAPI
jgi:hypothetical protein